MNLENMVEDYLVCALWSSTDENGRPLDDDFGTEDIDAATTKQTEEDCKAFLEECQDVLEQIGEYPFSFGHDFWLSRNGHGAGFFDRVGPNHPHAKLYDILQDRARVWGSVDLYVGDDGNIYS